MGKQNIINVTQPYLPPLDEFVSYLEKIWEDKWITNDGPFHRQFEKELASYLGVPYVSLFTNGTLALLTALQALDIEGEVITTPYTFVATAHALVWNKLTPVFIDIDPVYGNIDSGKIENAITDKTSAILPVHVYGNPCNTEMIQNIADKNNLSVIYDAAHAFGVRQNGESILNKGDLSILSFHATKVFNTFEGGAIVSHSPEMKYHIDNLKNFGFRGETNVEEVGINGKMNEVQAAMGLLQLKYIDKIVQKRKHVAEFYKSQLKGVRGIRFLQHLLDVDYNFAYFPIFIDEKYGKSRDELYELLKQNNINCRRYFYPLVTDFPSYGKSRKISLNVARQMSDEVLCLPIYPELEQEMLEKIVGLI